MTMAFKTAVAVPVYMNCTSFLNILLHHGSMGRTDTQTISFKYSHPFTMTATSDWHEWWAKIRSVVNKQTTKLFYSSHLKQKPIQQKSIRYWIISKWIQQIPDGGHLRPWPGFTAGRKISNMTVWQRSTNLHEFHGHQFEAPLLQAADDFADQSTVDCIRLEHEESSFALSHNCWWKLSKEREQCSNHATFTGYDWAKKEEEHVLPAWG